MSSSQHASVSMATSSKPALFQVQRTESEGWVGGVGGREEHLWVQSVATRRTTRRRMGRKRRSKRRRM